MKVDSEALDILTQCRCDGVLMFLPDIQLDRELYVKVNKALTALGGKWNRGKKAHVFPEQCEDIIDQLIFTGEYVDNKKELQQFYSPKVVAEKMWELLNPEFNCYVLEPSAGEGHLLNCSAIIDDRNLMVECIEIDPKNVERLESQGYEVTAGDFLDNDLTYEYIIMNPPFSKGQDIAHVTHAINCADTKVVALMSPGWQFRQGKKYDAFRELLDQHVVDWEPLPEKSFKESGTNVSTGILTIHK